MIYDFNGTQVATQVRNLADRSPEFVYTMQAGYSGSECGYAGAGYLSDKGQSCIVGQALQDLGVSRNVLWDIENRYGSLTASEVLEKLAISADEDTANWLLEAQYAQDNGHSWSESVQIADDVWNETQAFNDVQRSLVSA